MKHEIIYTKHYALIISYENIKDVCKNFLEGDLKTNTLPIYSNTLGESKKIIAYRPLKDAPIIEGVPLLPDWNVSDEELLVPFPNSTQSGKLRDGSEIKTWMLGWEEGYKEAKETHIEILKSIESLCDNQNPTHDGIWRLCRSLQQPERPKYFECEMEKVWVRNTDRNAPTLDDFDTIVKTTTNSQGQTELLGRYIF